MWYCRLKIIAEYFSQKDNFWSKVSPQIYVSPRNKSVAEGHPVNFSCKARGIPKPTLSWNYNDGDLPSGVNQTNLSEGSFLEFSNTTKDMKGFYKCTARNKANTTTSSAFLNVIGEQKNVTIVTIPYLIVHIIIIVIIIVAIIIIIITLIITATLSVVMLLFKA